MVVGNYFMEYYIRSTTVVFILFKCFLFSPSASNVVASYNVHVWCFAQDDWVQQVPIWAGREQHLHSGNLI